MILPPENPTPVLNVNGPEWAQIRGYLAYLRDREMRKFLDPELTFEGMLQLQGGIKQIDQLLSLEKVIKRRTSQSPD